MKEIKSTPRNLQQLLQNAKYSIDNYQREYRWQQRQIEELLDDLTAEFVRNYKLNDTRDAVSDYNIYFMGSIILAGRENAIVDGQQRLSSLTLLLMYLRNRLIKSGKSYRALEEMIYSEVRGTKSFNINVPERQACMKAILSRKSLSYNAIQEYIFRTAREIRYCPIDELKSKLKMRYDALKHSPCAVISDFSLNKSNKKHVKNILARITSFIEEQIGQTSHYVEYMATSSDNPFEIEHIICDHFERFTSDFTDKNEFDNWRDRISALLLLRKSINASLSDSDYPKKREKYCSADGNIYAASLDEQTYRNNPRFIRFIEENNLSFEPYENFGKAEIEKRTQLVIQLVNLVWNTEDFK